MRSLSPAFFLLLGLPVFATPARAGETPAEKFRSALRAARGPVGCVRGGPLLSEEKCSRIHAALLQGKELFAHEPKEFKKVLGAELEGIRTPENYNYTAILIAAMTENRDFIPVLDGIAKLEEKSGIRYPYAKHASMRLQRGHCESGRAPIFGEVCESTDLEFHRAWFFERGKSDRERS